MNSAKTSQRCRSVPIGIGLGGGVGRSLPAPTWADDVGAGLAPPSRGAPTTTRGHANETGDASRRPRQTDTK